jgi:hypothetical protein
MHGPWRFGHAKTLHEWLLAGWGMPIGELFYLEELSKKCKELGRYTFFLSSSPMNVSALQ